MKHIKFQKLFQTLNFKCYISTKKRPYREKMSLQGKKIPIGTPLRARRAIGRYRETQYGPIGNFTPYRVKKSLQGSLQGLHITPYREVIVPIGVLQSLQGKIWLKIVPIGHKIPIGRCFFSTLQGDVFSYRACFSQTEEELDW